MRKKFIAGFTLQYEARVAMIPGLSGAERRQYGRAFRRFFEAYFADDTAHALRAYGSTLIERGVLATAGVELGDDTAEGRAIRARLAEIGDDDEMVVTVRGLLAERDKIQLSDAAASVADHFSAVAASLSELGRDEQR